MMPLSALPPAPGTPAGVDLPAAQAGEAAQGADFLAILSIQTGEVAGPPLPGAELALPESPASAANAAAMALPESGKILPSALPVLPVLADLPEVTADQPPAPQPNPAAPLPLALARVLIARAQPEDRATAKVQQPEAPEQAEAAEAAALPEAQPLVAMIAPVLPTAPQSAEFAAEPAAPRAAAAPQVAALPQRASGEPQAPAQQPAPAQPVLTVSAALTPPAPVALAPLQLAEAAAPVAASLRVVARTEPGEIEPAQPMLPDLAAPFTHAAPASAAAAPTGPAQVAPVTRPHEFAALVDRLVAARDALQPQPVSLAVQHAEFGPVQLHFRHDQGGLSVSLASADPDFARAVSAAVPPVQAAAASDSTAFGSAPRQDQSAASSADSFGQQRGQSAAQRDERGPRANPAPQAGSARQPDQSDHEQQGIYA